MGFTATRIIPNESENSCAFAVCGTELCHIDYTYGRTSGLSIHSIWFTERDNPALQQSPVVALCQVPYGDVGDRGWSEAIACISGSEFSIARLDGERKVIPRRIPIPDATPSRITYSPNLGKIITASLRTHLPVISPEEINTNVAQLEVLDAMGVVTTKPLAERIFCMLDWTYTADTGDTYGFLLLGLGDPEEAWGSVLFLSSRLTGSGALKEKFYLEFDHPVLALALYDATKLVIAAGSSVEVFSFDTIVRK